MQRGQLQGDAAKKRADSGKDVQVPKLDDIVSYQAMFARLMEANEVSLYKWLLKLAAHYVGKAQEIHAASSSSPVEIYEPSTTY